MGITFTPFTWTSWSMGRNSGRQQAIFEWRIVDFKDGRTMARYAAMLWQLEQCS